MRPAFSSIRQAAAFALLLLALLTAPLWMTGRLLPPREQRYAAQTWFWGPYPWVHHEIFEETNDIDIAFMGSSHMAYGMDTPYVQAELDRHAGHKTVVRSVVWGGPDFDCLYFIAKDLLEHRKVKMLVFYDESPGHFRNAQVPVWFRWGEDASDLDGIALRDKVPFYFAALVGIPRNAANLLRPTIPASLSGTNYLTETYKSPNPAGRLGSIACRMGYRASPKDPEAPFSSFQPTNATGPDDVCIYSSATSNQFAFEGQSIPGWQMHFARKFAEMAAQHGCRLVLLHIPVFADRGTTKITESQFWPEALRAPVRMAGIPPEKFFAGMTEDQSRKLFCDPAHLNPNGQAYFTPLITPTLIRLYEESSEP